MKFRLNPAQRHYVAALAARVARSTRAPLILELLAAARLEHAEHAPKQLAGMTCKQVYDGLTRQARGCTCEAVRKLLIGLAQSGVVDSHKGRYALADDVTGWLRRLSGPSADKAASPEPSMDKAPASRPVTSEIGAEGTGYEVNKRAIRCFVDVTARFCCLPRSMVWLQITACRSASLSQLADAASGFAVAILSNRGRFSHFGDLQDVLDGRSTIEPLSAATFAFAYESFQREIAAEVRAGVDAAHATAWAPRANDLLEALMKQLAPETAPGTAPDRVENAATSPSPSPQDERPLAKIFVLRAPDEYGSAV